MTIDPDALYRHKTSGRDYQIVKFVKVRTPDGDWEEGVEYMGIATSLFYVTTVQDFLNRLEIAATPEDSPWAQS